jgi:hypothetical protein
VLTSTGGASVADGPSRDERFCDGHPYCFRTTSSRLVGTESRALNVRLAAEAARMVDLSASLAAEVAVNNAARHEADGSMLITTLPILRPVSTYR